MDSINQVLVLTLMILVGVYSTKKGFVDDRVRKGLTDILVNITLPFMIIYSFMIEYNSTIADRAIKIAIYTVIIIFALYIVAKIIFKKVDERKKPVMIFMTIFTNCAFMGYPVLKSIYGDIGVFYASIYTMVFTALVWTLGVSIFAGKMSLKESMLAVIRNRAIWGVAIGVILFVTQLQVPYVIAQTLKSIGDMTTPISMIIIGSMLCGSNIKAMLKDKYLIMVIFMAQIAAPLLVFVTMNILGIDELLTGICTLLVAMPGAAIGPVIAVNQEGDAVFTSECVFATTLFSVVSIPIFMMII